MRLAQARGGMTSDDEFEALIASRLESNPTQRFFLATDNAQSQSWLLARHGAAVCVWQQIEPEGEAEGKATAERTQSHAHRHTPMAHAVIDLWLLSMCASVHGSNGSSYSAFAQHMRGEKPAFRY